MNTFKKSMPEMMLFVILLGFPVLAYSYLFPFWCINAAKYAYRRTCNIVSRIWNRILGLIKMIQNYAFNIIIIGTIFFASTLSVSFLFATAILNHGDPATIEWQEQKDGTRKAKIRFDESIDKSLHSLQEVLGMPTKINFLESWLIAFTLGLLAVIPLMIRQKLEEEWVVVPTLLFQLLLFFLVITTVITNAYHYDAALILENTILDKELRDKVIGKYYVYRWIYCFGVFITLLVTDFLVVIIGGILTVRLVQPTIDILKSIIKRSAKRMLDQSGLRENTLLFSGEENGVIDLVSYKYRLRWLPFPVLVPQKDVERRVTLDSFFRILTSQSKETAFSEMREKLQTSSADKYDQVGTQATSRVVRELSTRLKSEFESQARGWQKKVKIGSLKEAENLLQKSSDRTLARFKLDVTVGLSEEVDEQASGFNPNFDL